MSGQRKADTAYQVLAVLADGQPRGLHDLHLATRRSVRRLTRAVDALMADGRVVDEWVEQPGGRPVRRLYRAARA